MADIVVRECTPDECAAIDDLLLSVYVGEGYTPTDHSQGLADAGERARNACVLVAVDAATGALLGSATVVTSAGPAVRISQPGEAEIRLLAVAAPARRRGAGHALTRACIDRAREAGCTRAVLSTQPGMKAAHRVYERLGFVRAPSRDHARPSGALMLVYEVAL